MTDSRTIRRYLPWLVLPVLMLAAAAVVQERLAATVDAGGLGEQVRLKDAKVSRTVRFHDMADLSATAAPLYQRNAPGVAIDIEMDPRTFALMLVKANRRRFKERATDATVRFAGGAPAPATIGLRGVGTLKMLADKVSFKVKMFQKEAVTPDVKLKRFYLMNMAHDPHEVELVFSYRLLSGLGLFPLHFQYARVAVNGEPQGMYLLVEPPAGGLRREHEDITAIFRRRKPNIFQTVWTVGAPDSGASINALRLASYPQPTEVSADALGAALDLDDYFTWLAACSVLMNPDVADELYLFEVRKDRARPAPLRVLAWDFDDMAGKPGPGAVGDRLIFSCKYPLDLRVRESERLYGRYRQTLRHLLTDELAIDRLVAALHEVGELRDGLDDGRGQAVQAEARRLRAEAVAEIERKLRARHAELLRQVGE